MSRRLAVYFLHPVEGTKHKYVMVNPSEEQVQHHLWVAGRVASGAQTAKIGLYAFHEVDLASGALGPVVDMMLINPWNLGRVVVEEDAAPVQETLIKENAA